MEEANLKKSDFAKKKSIRRRSQSHTRKSAHLINMAEARRDIVNALHLHRLSSSSTSGTAGNSTWTSQNCYQLMESMPIPEPTWSTTPPAVMCAPVPSVEVLEFGWPENMSSSYTWWIGRGSSVKSFEDCKKIHSIGYSWTPLRMIRGKWGAGAREELRQELLPEVNTVVDKHWTLSLGFPRFKPSPMPISWTAGKSIKKFTK
ncbi:unnamed protein product [Fraxinus pennsylvanica]|uniref:Uncharacterized protein n=1 Tax=Fraxinus pennsylvanica TaxID=56036 RepID=A0AAD2EC60_9LAMI|nr:unnamed protein product [Fraxinus pennsylvanica]